MLCAYLNQLTVILPNAMPLALTKEITNSVNFNIHAVVAWVEVGSTTFSISICGILAPVPPRSVVRADGFLV